MQKSCESCELGQCFLGYVFIGALDTKFIVSSLSDVWFVFWSRTNWELIFEVNQSGLVKFALSQLIVGVFYGVCGRVPCLKCGNVEHFLCKWNAITSMECFNFSFYFSLQAYFVIGLAKSVATLKWDQILNIISSNVFWR